MNNFIQMRRSVLAGVAAAICCRHSTLATSGIEQIQTGACGFLDALVGKSVPIVDSADNASAVIGKICESVALPPNFKLIAVTDPSTNAVAQIVEDDRFIIYDRKYMSTVSSSGLLTWPALAVIAHEIGHHLCGHTLKTDGSRPPLELEADHFAGFALARMGATRDEALELWARIMPDIISTTHPPRHERVEAADSGWYVATTEKGGGESLTLTSANQNSIGTYDRVISTFVNHKTFWEERQHGQTLALFMEMKRTRMSIFLYDPTRVMTVRMDLSHSGGIASGYWQPSLITDLRAGWSPLDPMFWPTGMRSSDSIKD